MIVFHFLNGGLFECLDERGEGEKKEERIWIDGFSDNLPKDHALIVPDYLFFGVEEEADLSKVVGVADKKYKKAAVKGLINILKSYKFTITENTPIEEDVALDPELLGKVFENLLASYNPETKTTARKQTGSFYTPREIVNYMVDESLIAYLKNKILNEPAVFVEFGKAQAQIFGNDLKKGQHSLMSDINGSELKDKPEQLDILLHELVSFNPGNPFKDFPATVKHLLRYLSECTILDPACGSGAFPMGILQKMVHILQKLDPDNRAWKEVQLQKAEKDSKAAFEIEDKQAREERLIEINEAFDQNINDPDYARKLFLIENCIYGVDIQPIAVQISKLRFFISLVVEQKTKVTPESNFGIRPLPNLETKFVAANTLIGIEKPNAQLSLYDTKEVKALEAELKKVRSKLFSAKSKDTKLKYRQRDEELRNTIATELEKSGWKSDTAQKLAGWDPYDQNASSSFFDPEWMFDIKDGFDVVIGNPPYVFGGSEKISAFEKKYFKLKFASGTQKINLFAIFIEKGIQLLKNERFISFIIPNTLLRVTSYSNIRKYIYENTIISEVNDLDIGIFDGVTASTIIIRLQKNQAKNRSNLITIKKGVASEVFQKVQQAEYGNTGFILDIFTKSNDRIILSKLANNSIPLGEITKMIRFGVVITKNITEVVGNSEISKVYKPFLEGDEIAPFGLNYKGRYLHYEPSLLHRSRTPDVFEEPKIMIQRITGGSRPVKATFDTMGFYNKESILNLQLKSDEYSYFYILSLLNSSTINWFYKQKFTNNSKLTVNLSKEYLEQIPIKQCNKFSQSAIITIGRLLTSFFKRKDLFKVLNKTLDALVFNLYFPEHMKERGIDVLEFVEGDIQEVMQGRDFETLPDAEKEKVIAQLHAIWSHSDNEVSKRINLFAVRSPEILKPILES